MVVLPLTATMRLFYVLSYVKYFFLFLDLAKRQYEKSLRNLSAILFYAGKQRSDNLMTHPSDLKKNNIVYYQIKFMKM